MLSKPERICSQCPLFLTGKGFVPDQLVSNPLYTLYGEAPGKTEVTDGKPFQGKAGFVLKNWLIRNVSQVQLAFEKNRISFRNVLKCLPPEIKGRPYPVGVVRKQAEECCKQHMQGSDAETVILLGEVPQRFFFGAELDAEDAADRQLRHDTKGVMGRVGRTYTREGKRYVFAPHPAYILRQPALVEHGQRAFAIATGAEQVLEVQQLKWEDAIPELT